MIDSTDQSSRITELTDRIAQLESAERERDAMRKTIAHALRWHDDCLCRALRENFRAALAPAKPAVQGAELSKKVSDQIAYTPLHGPATYNFGETTPQGWPKGEYVPKAVYNALEAELAMLVKSGVSAGTQQQAARIRELEAALRRHRKVIVRCCANGVLRHDLNVFLAAEADVLGSSPSDGTGGVAYGGGGGGNGQIPDPFTTKF